MTESVCDLLTNKFRRQTVISKPYIPIATWLNFNLNTLKDLDQGDICLAPGRRGE